MTTTTKHPNGVWPGGQPRSHGNAFDSIYQRPGQSIFSRDRSFTPANSDGMDASARASRAREALEQRGTDTSIKGLKRVIEKEELGERFAVHHQKGGA